MDQSDFFHHRQDIFELSHRIRPIPMQSANLNPWTEHETVNPYLNMKKQARNTNAQLKKINQRKKMLSLDYVKSTKNLLTYGTKQITEPTKIPRELPKLNIDQLMKNESQRKKRTVNNTGRHYLLNSSPMYFSSPALKKISQTHDCSELGRRSKILPCVSRELNITRKIYLLQNKLNNTNTPSPVKRSFRQEGGDIRRLVEKQWSRKL